MLNHTERFAADLNERFRDADLSVRSVIEVVSELAASCDRILSRHRRDWTSAASINCSPPGRAVIVEERLSDWTHHEAITYCSLVDRLVQGLFLLGPEQAAGCMAERDAAEHLLCSDWLLRQIAVAGSA